MGTNVTVTFGPASRTVVALLGGAVLLVLAVWLAYDTVHSMDGPWGRPGLPGTLTVAECVTEHHGGGDPPTMTCTGAFTSGRSTISRVHFGIDHVKAWFPGESIQVRLSYGSRTAYRPGSHDWLIRLGLFLAILGGAVATFGSAGTAGRIRQRVQAAGAVIFVSAIPVPLLVLLYYLIF